MSTIYHFGDSYGLCAKSRTEPLKHFVEICADTIGFEYSKLTWVGVSNEMLFNSMLGSLHLYKPKDIIFINFSFWVRGCYWDEKFERIKSTNNLFGELDNMKLYPNQLTNSKIDELQLLIDYYLNMTEDYNRKLFTLINSLFHHLQRIGVRIYYIFIDKSNDWCDSLLTSGHNLKFENGFSDWLIKNRFHNEEESHYTAGIQNMLSSFILSNTDNLKLGPKHSIIKMDDTKLDLNLIIKNKTLL